MDFITFTRLWIQKILRNLASMKFWFLILLYIPTIYGMFNYKPGTTEVWITSAEGLTFLGGGFVTLATSRIIAKTKLTESSNDEIDCDK